jgi:2-hydroxy-3-keto-5-methylthiopentenyl-1-phosphate phosphatase
MSTIPAVSTSTRHYLVASDFDQTLSFNDSGLVLADLLGVRGFEDKVAGLADSNLVQQGGELAYLIRHDPEFRRVRREHLVEAGRRVRLKKEIPALLQFFARGFAGSEFSFVVVSAAPREVVESALSGLVPPDHIFASEFAFDPQSQEVTSVRRVPAGYGKVAVLDSLEHRWRIGADRIVYIGDGSSDVHVMLHVNNRDGFTIAVSENRQLARIARTTVLSDSAFSVLAPMLKHVLRLSTADIRDVFEAHGLTLEAWDHAEADRIVVSAAARPPVSAATA